MNHVRSPLLWFGDDALGWLIVFATGSRSSFVRFGVFCPLSRAPPPPAFGLDPALVVAFFDGRPLFLLTTMGGTVHRANPFIVVVVQPTVRIVIATLFPRGGLDRASDQLWMDLEMLTWHSDAFFPIDLFPFLDAKNPSLLRPKSERRRNRRRRLKTTNHDARWSRRRSSTFFSRGPFKVSRQTPERKKRARFYVTLKHKPI